LNKLKSLIKVEFVIKQPEREEDVQLTKLW